jgi:hypothetical protein
MLVLSATIVHIYRIEDVSSYNKVTGTIDFLFEVQGEANDWLKKIMLVPHRGKIYSVIITAAKYADGKMLMTGDIFAVQDEPPAPIEKSPVVEEPVEAAVKTEESIPTIDPPVAAVEGKKGKK